MLKLGFLHIKESHGNFPTNLTGFPSNDGRSGVSRVGSSLPKEKVCILTSGNEDSSEPPNLWFSATNLVEEDEASNSDSRRNHGNNTSERVDHI